MSASNTKNARPTVHRFAALSVVKHAYVPLGLATHPKFEPAVVADDADVPEWTHERNQQLADQFGVPYVRDVERALADFDVDVAVVSSEAERHCDLSVRAANSGKHVVQDKPMSTQLSECDRLVEAVERNDVRFLMWNRNGLPAVIQARDVVESGQIGRLYAVHVDFYFSKDAGPRKGSRPPGYPPIRWLDRQIEAHHDGSDGGVGQDAMGELAVEGIYPLAYIRLLGGVEVQRVFARTTAHFHQAHADNHVDDLASVTLEMDDGLLGTMSLGRIGASSHPDIGEIKIHLLGSEGAMVVSEPRPEVGVYYRGQPVHEFRNRRVGVENDFHLAENFRRAIESGGKTMLDVRESRAICATVEAAIRSGRSGQPEIVNRIGATS
ncbi:MAG: Gfo/Idh/MocA family oxidoreductase [Planctomycetota bacterium]|nr:Gfo/Idh/MocA family oxidoreductase [Planctomycetota bacterium]